MKVHVLDKSVSELIAAGEVIERPSSVVKELIENSIDSGATVITVEIKRGGISYLRITDNGCGMAYEDVPTAFLRHATSKVSVRDDLNKIMTLGFRGEALASVCAVAKVEVLTKQREDELGTHYVIEGAVEKLRERSGCPDGTTIIVRDIFYNVPARLKFLKKDQYEGSAITGIMTKIAVSHPEISFRLIRDNKQEIFTPGDNRLYSAVYSVFGKEFAASQMPVDYSLGGIGIHGFTVRPVWGRKNRSMQHFFVNGRYVRSITCMSALEEAYRNTIMEGKFPACVLFLDMDPQRLDVNVHPAKTEVRFWDEKAVYDTVYFAVRNAILGEQRTHEMKLPEHKPTERDYRPSPFKNEEGTQLRMEDTSRPPLKAAAPKAIPVSVTEQDMTARKGEINRIKATQAVHHEVRVEGVPEDFIPKRDISADIDAAVSQAEASWSTPAPEEEAPAESRRERERALISEHTVSTKGEQGSLDSLEAPPEREFKYIDGNSFEQHTVPSSREGERQSDERRERDLRLVGEVFKTYVIAESDGEILIIDKHAAHERIRFERLRTGREHLTAQMLAVPVRLRLDYDEYEALVKNLKVCVDLGFSIKEDTAPFVQILGIPSMLDEKDAQALVTELAENFAAHRHDPLPEILDEMYHSMACKGAIKQNDDNTMQELEGLFREVLSDERIKYCPHGRPIMFSLSKTDLEKQFKRIV